MHSGLGLKGENYRANDTENPSGSAGLPIYNQLLGHDVTNIPLVVVCYYGGTKLVMDCENLQRISQRAT